MHKWLEQKLNPFIDNLERHVMLTVHHEFNSLFTKWFNSLVEEESTSVHLDDSFSVVVDQNGYETSIEHLSGGEKTAVALSYRLALNRVINDVVSTIKTKDLLILDEPTEGFSSSQLDNVRDILYDLGIAQTIIVSHESKIETFVDKVLRIEKRNTLSSIID